MAEYDLDELKRTNELDATAIKLVEAAENILNLDAARKNNDFADDENQVICNIVDVAYKLWIADDQLLDKRSLSFDVWAALNEARRRLCKAL